VLPDAVFLFGISGDDDYSLRGLVPSAERQAELYGVQMAEARRSIMPLLGTDSLSDSVV